MVAMNQDKFAITLILVLSFFVIYYSDFRHANDQARIWNGDEKEFFKAIDIVWRGKIISTMAGGSCIGLKGEFGIYSKAIACLSNKDSEELWKLDGSVTIKGKWLGITCAYKNTIFGSCVPDVIIESIGQ